MRLISPQARIESSTLPIAIASRMKVFKFVAEYFHPDLSLLKALIDVKIHELFVAGLGFFLFLR